MSSELIEKSAVIRICESIADTAAEYALTGEPDNARAREGMEAAATKIKHLVAHLPSPTPSGEVGALIKRARGYLAMNAAESGADVLIDELASLLLSLDAERGRMREALKPFADAAERWTDIPGVLRYGDSVQLWQNGRRVDYITVGDLRRARSALPASDEKEA